MLTLYLVENLSLTYSQLFTYSVSPYTWFLHIPGFPGGLDGKDSACNAGYLGLIPGSGRSPGEGNGNPLQYSCLENPMDGGACQHTGHGVAKSWTEQLTVLYPCIHAYN